MAESSSTEGYQMPVQRTTDFFTKAKEQLPPETYQKFLESYSQFTTTPPESIDQVRDAVKPYLQGYPELLNDFEGLMPPPEDSPEGKALIELKEKVANMNEEEKKAFFTDYFQKQFEKHGVPKVP